MLTDADGALANEDTGKLTKANLIEEVSKVTALHWQEAASIVECILDSMVHAIERGDKVEIRGFGVSVLGNAVDVWRAIQKPGRE
jgi:hypothetical protein